MTRQFLSIAAFELVLASAIFGLPMAKADPGLCCNDPKHEECSGCVGNYNIPQGELYACLDAWSPNGCDIYRKKCAEFSGQIARYSDTNCSVFYEYSQGVVIYMDGCDQTNCD
jgi:hypothetical protein